MSDHKNYHSKAHLQPKSKNRRFAKLRKLASRRRLQRIALLNDKTSLSSRIGWFLCAIAVCFILYLVIFLSTAPRSIPFITQKIQQQLDIKFDKQASIKGSSVKLTHYGSLKVIIDELRIYYQKPNFNNFFLKDEEKFLMIPKIELDFSIFDLVLIDLKPNKIRVVNPSLSIKNLKMLASSFKDHDQTEELPSELDQNQTNKNAVIAAIATIFSQIENSDNLPTKNLEIENANLFFKVPKIIKHTKETQSVKLNQNSPLFSQKLGCNSENCLINSIDEDKKIIVKKATIKIENKISGRQIMFSSKIDLGEESSDFTQNLAIEIESSCQGKSSKQLGCNLKFNNLATSELTEFYPELFTENKFDGVISGNFDLSLKDGDFENLKFGLRSDAGKITAKKIFPSLVEIKNLTIGGDYDQSLNLLTISQIRADLVSNIANQTEVGNPKLNGSGSFYFGNPNNQLNAGQLNLVLSIINLLNDDVQRFWPLNFNQKEIRDWYLNHIKSGKINSGQLKLTLDFNEEGASLQDIKARVGFEGFNLNYDEKFPPITEISGVATFLKNSMDIAINKGKVLESELKNSHVKISDFNKQIPILEISGESAGNPADGIKHANSDIEFEEIVEKFLNGSSQNRFLVNIPLITNNQNVPKLSDCYIGVESKIFNLKNDFVSGDLMIKTEKKVRSLDFTSEIDLTQSKIISPELGILKPKLAESSLNFILSFAKENFLAINDLTLTEKASENKDQNNSENLTKSQLSKKPNSLNKKIIAEALINTKQGELVKATLQNQGFDNNNYKISFDQTSPKSLKILINGKSFNLEHLIKNGSNLKFFSNSKNSDKTKFIIVSLSKIQLQNNKKLDQLSANLFCNQNLCNKGRIKAAYHGGKSMLINIENSENSKEKTESQNQQIEGYIQEIGFLAEGLNLSKVISQGDVKIKIKQNPFTKKTSKSQVSSNAKNKNSKSWSSYLPDFIANNKPEITSKFEGEIILTSPITIFENESVKKLAKDTLFSKIRDKIFASEKTIFTTGKVNFHINGDELNIDSLVLNNLKIGITSKGKINLKTGEIQLNGMIIPGYVLNSLFGIGKIPLIGSVVKGILIGGEEGGGVFGLRYEYVKKPSEKEGKFTTNKIAAFVPTTIQNLFEN